MGLLALVSLGACSSNPATICATPTLIQTEVVGLRLIGEDAVELVLSSDSRTLSLSRLTGISQPERFAMNLEERGVVYVWIGNSNSDQFPKWLSTSDQEPLMSTQCRLGERATSVVVTNGNVTLMQDANEITWEAPPAGALGGQISLFG